MSVRRYLLKLPLEIGSVGLGRLRETLGDADSLKSSGLYLHEVPGPDGCGAREEKKCVGQRFAGELHSSVLG